ncbi:hypothetical protein H1P_5570002 [Hyella patelloides LEGE 07179]|uniref:Uncharacterized protein n=1 Tax=Hyella patelloides LEGE 07179 TaxID=945734 RepID=A0A563W0J2_9CYAN|nr:hypothetical protein H1P_5570002 [Hyella patelloides LEGE 07179]
MDNRGNTSLVYEEQLKDVSPSEAENKICRKVVLTAINTNQ